jgi:hypothetical protein
MATTIRAHIYAREEMSFAKFLFLPSWFAKLLETNFSCFAKIRWMPSWFVKLLELLLVRLVYRSYFPVLLPLRLEHFSGQAGLKKIRLFRAEKVLHMTIPLYASGLKFRTGLGPGPGLYGPPAYFIV